MKTTLRTLADFAHRAIALLLAALVILPSPYLLAGPSECGNPDYGSICESCDEATGEIITVAPEDGQCPAEEDGSNRFRVAGGNVFRSATDLRLHAGAGQHRLAFTRHAFSRYSPAKRWFGEAHGWRHSYQWEMVDVAANKVQITKPNGAMLEFTKSGSSWAGRAYYKETLSQSGTVYTLQTQDGWRYRFDKLTDGSGASYYQLQEFRDPHDLVYPLTYDAAGRLLQVAEPAGRWLQIHYTDIEANQSRFSDLAVVPAIPPAGQWSELAVTDPTPYRYLRYRSPSYGHGNVAEVEFYTTDELGQEVKLTGTVFGATPTSSGNTPAKAFDGNTSTFYDYSSKSFGFIGLDLGAGNEKRVTKVRYWPRSGQAARMYHASNSGRFQGSNTSAQTLPVISHVTASDGRNVHFEYDLQADPVLAYDWVSLAHATYNDATQASYTYTQKWPGTPPLLTEVNDPRADSRATRMKYEYWFNDHVTGNLKAERNALDNTLIAQLDGTGSESSKVTYGDGRVRNYKWPENTASRVTDFTDALGRKVTYGYGGGGQGHITSFKDPQGRTTTYTRGTRGVLLGRTQPDGSTVSWTRNSFGQPLTYTDELGRVTTWTRDALRRVTRVDYPDASFETFAYNAFGQVTEHRRRNGGLVTSTYDAAGRLTSRTDATGAVTAYTYNAHDLPATVTDTRSKVTEYEYSDRGQLVEVTQPDATTLLYGYDAYGNRVQSINELGHAWTMTYDVFNRRTSETDPLNRTTSYDYGIGALNCDSCHTSAKPTQITSPGGRVVKIVYNAEWQKLSETVGFGTPEAATTSYAYDNVGDLVTVTDPRGKAWTFTYDNRHRRITAGDPLGNTTTWTYDAAGNKLTERRPDNGVTTMTYDAMNRVLTTTNPNSETTTFTYGGRGMIADDKGDNLVRLTDARNNAYDFTYDYEDRKTKMGYPDLTAERWTYDAVGNLLTYTTRAGQVRTCTLDDRNRDILCDWSDTTPDITKTYDAAGRLLTMSSSVSTLTYTYDHANQLLSETQDLTAPVDLPAKTVSYTYDLDGNRAALTYPDGTVVQYSYTARNQMKEVIADGPPPLATYSYDLAGNRTGKTLENGTSTTYTYDDASRLTNLSHALTINGAPSSISYAYALNNVGNRTARTETIAGTAKTDAYSYDPTDQITGVKYEDNPGAGTFARKVDYAYDATGNRTTVTEDPDGTGPNPAVPTPYTANNLNQYTAIDALAPPAYDGNGNLTQHQAKLSDPTWTYSYDAQNRLISGSNTAGTAFSFAYDARNRCIARTINGTTILYLFDEWSLLDERTAADVQQAEYVHGATIDELLTITTASGTAYYHHDGLGSTTALSTATGALLETASYDVYGAPTLRDPTGNVLASSPAGNRFLFTGREWVSEVGLYDYRNRVYSAEVGRFLQTDPIDFSGGDINLYGYVSNSVSDWIDPSGLKALIRCLRCKDGGQMKCRYEINGRVGEPFDANMSGTGGAGPIPEGTYDVRPKDYGPRENTLEGDGIKYRRGTPSITSQDLRKPGAVRHGSRIRTGIRIHGPGPSLGCVACAPGEQPSGRNSSVENLMNTYPDLEITITDVCCKNGPPKFPK